jgi:uncharacterized protein
MSAKRKVPQRQCVGCGELKNKKELIRVIKTPEDTIILDDTGKKNGRGAYICSSFDCFHKAVASKGLERSLKRKIPKEVYEVLEEELKAIDRKKE